MTEGRRTVRATVRFFTDLDGQLTAERGPRGEPSIQDFQAFELLRIVEWFATTFDALPELIAGRPDYRLLIATGVLIPAYSVIGQLGPDGAVELIRLAVRRRTIPRGVRAAIGPVLLLALAVHMNLGDPSDGVVASYLALAVALPIVAWVALDMAWIGFRPRPDRLDIVRTHPTFAQQANEHFDRLHARSPVS